MHISHPRIPDAAQHCVVDFSISDRVTFPSRSNFWYGQSRLWPQPKTDHPGQLSGHAVHCKRYRISTRLHVPSGAYHTRWFLPGRYPADWPDVPKTENYLSRSDSRQWRRTICGRIPLRVPSAGIYRSIWWNLNSYRHLPRCVPGNTGWFPDSGRNAIRAAHAMLLRQGFYNV